VWSMDVFQHAEACSTSSCSQLLNGYNCLLESKLFTTPGGHKALLCDQSQCSSIWVHS
jgi:hypothetical protein